MSMTTMVASADKLLSGAALAVSIGGACLPCRWRP